MTFYQNIKPTNIHMTGVPEGEETECTGNPFEEGIAENLLTWERKQTHRPRNHTDTQTRGTQGGHTKTLIMKLCERFRIKRES